jgi:hypothetical protein
MGMLERLKGFYRKMKPELAMAGIAAAVVFAVYLVINLIVWNTANLSYAIFFALVAFVFYFVAKRLINFVATKKEGVIEKPK